MRIRAALAAAGTLLLVACGGQGLPPAGPAPGEVDVGYGSQPAAKVTGAVTTVTEEQLDSSQPLSVIELLRARVPGLQVMPGVNGGYAFRIRGTNSLLADEEPLFVLDGAPISTGNVQNALSGIRPSDVRQIDVLKDVSSTSIYGSRGAGGVILITTRR